MIKKLLVNDGRRERELVLVERLVVGRDPTCDVSHDDALLSRRHAEFVSDGGAVTVRDLGSRNGVFVNGARTAERSLNPGDVIQIGPLRVRYTPDGAPVSILPEDLIADGTVMLPHPSAAPPPPPPARAATSESDSNERTRVVVPIPQRPFDSRDHSLAQGRPDKPLEEPLDEDATRFVAAPRSNAAGGTRITEPVPAAPRPAAPEASSARPESRLVGETPVASVAPAALESGVRTFVFVQLFALTGVVLLSALVPLTMASVPLAWLALPAFAAVIATYLVANLINRRFADILRRATTNSPAVPRS